MSPIPRSLRAGLSLIVACGLAAVAATAARADEGPARATPAVLPEAEALGIGPRDLSHPYRDVVVDETVRIGLRFPAGMVAIATNSGGHWFHIDDVQVAGRFVETIGFFQRGTFDYAITLYPRKSPTEGTDYTRPSEVVRYRFEVRSTISERDYWARTLARGRLPNDASAAIDAAWDYRAIDAWARAVPDSALANPVTLARYLARGASSEREVARALFTWINDNIRFEVTNVIDPDPVFAARKGQCAGIMLLYRAMARVVGLEAYGVGGEAGLTSEGHAWNVVRVDGIWRLLDATWGQFFVPPEELAKSRFAISQYGVFALASTPHTRYDFYRALMAERPRPALADGPHRITSVESGKCLAALGDHRVAYRPCDDSAAQIWEVELLRSGAARRFVNRASGEALALLGDRRDVAGDEDLAYPYYDAVGDLLGTATVAASPKQAWELMAFGDAGQPTLVNAWSHKIVSHYQGEGETLQALRPAPHNMVRFVPAS